MSGSLQNRANALGAGVPMPGGEPVDVPEARALGVDGTPGGGGTGAPTVGVPDGESPGVPPTMSLADSHKTLTSYHGQVKAAFDHSSKILSHLDHTRRGLEVLTGKSDMVTPEDIIAEAAKLVGKGLDPATLAGFLADMPQEGGGEALAGWLADHQQAVAQAEQQMMAVHVQNRHQLGVTAMHMLMAHANADATAAPPGGGNALVGASAGAPATPAAADNALTP